MTKVAASSFILLITALAVTVVFRRAFCGQLCPLGALQGAAAGLGKRLWGRERGGRWQWPARIDRPLRWLKYGILAVVTGLTWVAGTLVVRPYDPWVAFMHLSSAELWSGFGVGAAVLLISLAASTISDRFFCKYLCPMGALYALVSKAGLYRVRRESASCIDCGACDRSCPVNLSVSKGRDVTSAECLACGLCVNACPVPGTLTIAGPRNSKVSPLVLTLITVALFVGVVIVTAVPGWFALSPKTLEEEVRASQNTEAASGTGGSAVFDPDLIKGRNTFSEVAKQSGVPLSGFVKAFGLSEADLDRPLKDVAAEKGNFDTDAVRTFVAASLGIDGYTSHEGK